MEVFGPGAATRAAAKLPLSENARAALLAASPITHVAAVRAPLLLFLGAADRRVPHIDGRAYATALRYAQRHDVAFLFLLALLMSRHARPCCRPRRACHAPIPKPFQGTLAAHRRYCSPRPCSSGACRGAGVPCEVQLFPKDTHALANPATALHQWLRCLQFLQLHVPTGGVAAAAVPSEGLRGAVGGLLEGEGL